MTTIMSHFSHYQSNKNKSINKSKIILVIFCCAVIGCFLHGCTKEDQGTSTINGNDIISGTHWKCCVWLHDNYSVHAELYFYNSNVKVTTFYRATEKTSSLGTYSINGNSIKFHNLSVRSANGQYFLFDSADLSHTILFVEGKCNYSAKSWEFREGRVQ